MFRLSWDEATGFRWGENDRSLSDIDLRIASEAINRGENNINK